MAATKTSVRDALVALAQAPAAAATALFRDLDGMKVIKPATAANIHNDGVREPGDKVAPANIVDQNMIKASAAELVGLKKLSGFLPLAENL
ncbi:MAG: hypothetical protein M1826_007551 [Phylliscum demangeonii]|nr:MAG: hypothetical protein M1826_007551 [Phylliscum demangeonii]